MAKLKLKFEIGDKVDVILQRNYLGRHMRHNHGIVTGYTSNGYWVRHFKSNEMWMITEENIFEWGRFGCTPIDKV